MASSIFLNSSEYYLVNVWVFGTQGDVFSNPCQLKNWPGDDEKKFGTQKTTKVHFDRTQMVYGL